MVVLFGLRFDWNMFDLRIVRDCVIEKVEGEMGEERRYL